MAPALEVAGAISECAASGDHGTFSKIRSLKIVPIDPRRVDPFVGRDLLPLAQPIMCTSGE
jgi:hypothetical protein